MRWTVGDVSARGFQALRLSILGARRVFGSNTAYAVCLNSVPLATAQARLEDAAEMVEWHVADGSIPEFIKHRLDPGLADGMAWKLAPLRLFRDRFEISLDNDCVIWRLPRSMAIWLDQAPDGARCLLAEDMATCFGWFTPLCGPEPRNAGIRGLPPGFDLEASLRDVLLELPGIRVSSEVDEQGMQVAALSRQLPPLVVSKEDVTICSPVPPHVAKLGHCGAHFVGLNMRRPRPEHGCDQALLDRIAAHWDAHRPTVEAMVQQA